MSLRHCPRCVTPQITDCGSGGGCWSSEARSGGCDVPETDCASRACSPDDSAACANAGLGPQIRTTQIIRQYAKDGTTFLIRAIDMTSEAPFKLACVLSRNLSCCHPSKLEVQRELDLACAAGPRFTSRGNAINVSGSRKPLTETLDGDSRSQPPTISEELNVFFPASFLVTNKRLAA